MVTNARNGVLSSGDDAMSIRVRSGHSILLVQTAIGDYRQAFVDGVRVALRESLAIVAGTEYFTSTVRTSVSAGDTLRLVRNRFMFARRLVWQSGVVLSAVRPASRGTRAQPSNTDELDRGLPHRRALRRRTLSWGHAWPRSGSAARSDLVRSRMRNLADGLILYTESQRRELAVRGYRKPVWVAANGLYPRSMRCGIPSLDAVRSDVVCVGRLDAEKRPRLLLEAFSQTGQAVRRAGHLIFIGEGPES